MRRTLIVTAVLAGGMTSASMGMLTNGNLDQGYAQEIVPGFFLPKPRHWINEGSRTITGAYEDEMSLEPWAGPAPTPVTTDGDAAFPDGIGIGNDGGVFFKPFTGNSTNGAATGHLYQDVAATAGVAYVLSAWAGAEANYSGLIPGTTTRTVLAMDFLGAGGAIISSAELDLVAAGLGVPNGLSFNYKNFSVSAIAPAGTASLRARMSMIDAFANPAGGGQALVVDDFTLGVVPEPTTLAVLGGVAVLALRRRA